MHGYAGQYGYQEDGNGLRLLGHRYYDSDTGRFLSQDPIKNGKNWYSYCGGNPVSRSDPSGLFAPAVIAALAAVPVAGWVTIAVIVVVASAIYVDKATGGAISDLIIEQIDSIGRRYDNPIADPDPQPSGSPLGRPFSPPIAPTEEDGYEEVYRVWGGGSREYGESWTNIDPRSMKDPRDELVLPDTNSGTRLTKGLVRMRDVDAIGRAGKLDGNRGGAPELIIVGAEGKIIVTGRFWIDPAF